MFIFFRNETSGPNNFVFGNFLLGMIPLISCDEKGGHGDNIVEEKVEMKWLSI